MKKCILKRASGGRLDVETNRNNTIINSSYFYNKPETDNVFSQTIELSDIPKILEKYGNIILTDYNDVIEVLIYDAEIEQTADSYYNK